MAGLPDQWILARLQAVTAGTTDLLERFDLGAAASQLYEFIWSEYCDWYIELSKPRLNQTDNHLERRATQAVSGAGLTSDHGIAPSFYAVFYRGDLAGLAAPG